MPASLDENKGTCSHMAPELLLPEAFGLDGRVSKQADIYAFGMVVYEVLTGRIPSAGIGHGFAEIVVQVMQGKRPGKPENAEDIGFGRGTWELVQRCWDENRDRRPTVEDIFKHFKRVARTSKDVPPGSAALAPVVEVERPTASEPDSRSGKFGKCLVQVHEYQIQSHFHNIGSPTIRPFFSKHKHHPPGQACRRRYGWWRQAPVCSFCALCGDCSRKALTIRPPWHTHQGPKAGAPSRSTRIPTPRT
jgi:serine/threonine protein kinase